MLEAAVVVGADAGEDRQFLGDQERIAAALPEEWHSEPVRIDSMTIEHARVVKADVVSEENRYRHDSKKLADALIRLYYERNQMTDSEVSVAPALVPEAQKASVG